MSSKLPTEISVQKLFSGETQIVIRQDGTERLATLQDLQDTLRPLGLDLITNEALDWDVKYPGHAEHVTRICELQQQIADLEHELHELLKPPPELKRAAE